MLLHCGAVQTGPGWGVGGWGALVMRLLTTSAGVASPHLTDNRNQTYFTAPVCCDYAGLSMGEI